MTENGPLFSGSWGSGNALKMTFGWVWKLVRSWKFSRNIHIFFRKGYSWVPILPPNEVLFLVRWILGILRLRLIRLTFQTYTLPSMDMWLRHLFTLVTRYPCFCRHSNAVAWYASLDCATFGWLYVLWRSWLHCGPQVCGVPCPRSSSIFFPPRRRLGYNWMVRLKSHRASVARTQGNA